MEGVIVAHMKKGNIVWRIICIVVCVIFIPIIILNLVLTIKGAINKDKLPTAFGLSPTVVLSGSMSPVFEANDLIFIKTVDTDTIKAKDSTYEGDVICFRSGNDFVTHRVVRIQTVSGQKRFITAGDYTGSEDTGYVVAEDIQGKYVGKIPKIGGVVMFIQSPSGLVLTIILLLMLYIAGELLFEIAEYKNENKWLKKWLKTVLIEKQQQDTELATIEKMIEWLAIVKYGDVELLDKEEHEKLKQLLLELMVFVYQPNEEVISEDENLEVVEAVPLLTDDNQETQQPNVVKIVNITNNYNLPTNEDVNVINDVDIDYDDELDDEFDDDLGILVGGRRIGSMYKRSFMAKLIQSGENTQAIYTELKNYLLQYKKMRSRISWNNETFSYKREPLVKFAVRGKSLFAYLALNEKEREDIIVDEIVDSNRYSATPVKFKVTGSVKLGRVKKGIALICKRLDIEQAEMPTEEYMYPYETMEQLIERGLVKKKEGNPFQDSVEISDQANLEKKHQVL